MRPWRIALVCGYFDPTRDGVADYTRQLSRELRRGGLDAVVCTADMCVPEGSSSDVVGVTRRWDLPGVPRAARQLSKLRFDVVHVQFAPSAFGFARAVGLLPLLLPRRLPLALTLHEYGEWAADGITARLRSAAWTAVERRGQLDRETLLLVPRADELLVAAEQHAVVLRRRVGKLAACARYVPVGPNIAVTAGNRNQVRDEVRRELGMGRNAPLVLFFGFLHPVKGLPRLIEAVALVRPLFPGLRLVIAGGEESHSVRGNAATALRRRLEELAHRLQLNEAVAFTGYLPEQQVSRLLKAADVAVFPFDAGVTSKSGSLLAARCHGVPSIATAAPGTLSRPTEIDGILRVPPYDTAALAEALRVILSDDVFAGKLGASGQMVIPERSWQTIAAAHAEIYQELLDRTHRGPD